MPFKDKADSDSYVNKVLAGSLSPEEFDSLKKDGIPFDLWSRYRNKYDWMPVIKGGHSRDYVYVNYLNGEVERRWRNFDHVELGVLRPVPGRLTFQAIVNDVDTIFKVSFDELETMAAFEQLGADGQRVTVEFDPKRPRSLTTVRVYNENDSIQLTKTFSKDW